MKLRKAVDLMHEGSALMQMRYLVPGGEVSGDVADALIAMANVRPNNDGLFPGISQTWKIKS